MITKDEIKTKDFSEKMCEQIDKLYFLYSCLCHSEYHNLDECDLRAISYVLRDLGHDLGVIHETLYE